MNFFKKISYCAPIVLLCNSCIIFLEKHQQVVCTRKEQIPATYSTTIKELNHKLSDSARLNIIIIPYDKHDDSFGRITIQNLSTLEVKKYNYTTSMEIDTVLEPSLYTIRIKPFKTEVLTIDSLDIAKRELRFIEYLPGEKETYSMRIVQPKKFSLKKNWE